MECHGALDLLLIYRRTDTELILYRVGSHADFFEFS
ncbi:MULTISPECIES: type II toxin-antitoxin system YafQ family toxin [Photorhabdus]|nr:type II toxin-antitoxin system YafQ family toxin [Photorhabdus luminescens]